MCMSQPQRPQQTRQRMDVALKRVAERAGLNLKQYQFNWNWEEMLRALPFCPRPGFQKRLGAP